MSQQPPSPYGGPPGPYPPGPGQPAPSGMSNKAKFWIGVVLALPAMFLAGAVTGGVGAAAEAVTGSSDVASAAASVSGLGFLAAFIAAIVWSRTRWFALGALAGGALLLILAAGACIVILVALTNSYNG